MSRSPSLPDRPRLNLDPDMSPSERLAALRDHYERLLDVNRELEEQLEAARERRRSLTGEVDRLERENETLKTSSLYVATAEEITDDGVVVKQHGNNQEVLTGREFGQDLLVVAVLFDDDAVVGDLFGRGDVQ